MVGAALVILSATLCGMLLASRYRNRPKQLRQWRSALQSMEAEIVYGQLPIDQVARHLSSQLPWPVAHFFRRLSDELKPGGNALNVLWDELIEEVWPATALNHPEKDILKQFGATLGTQDVENQKKHIRLALAHLEREEAEAIEVQKKNEKMVKSLGFLAGLLIVLMLI
jgi:stage III sporulation protein AB